MAPELPATVASVVADFFGCLLPGIPFNAAARGLEDVLTRVIGQRLKTAHQLLLEELKSGDAVLSDVSQIDEMAAMLFRYMRAAQEGAARRNLCLMARAIKGQAHQGNLKSDEFLYYADIISSLRREEVLTLGTMLRHHSSKDWSLLEKQERMVKIQEASFSDLSPTVFTRESEFVSTLGALTRTGLLMVHPTLAMKHFRVSPLLLRMEKLVGFESLTDSEMRRI